MRTRTMLLMACLTLASCGPRIGDQIEVQNATLYTDQKSFESARQLVAAGEFPKRTDSQVDILHAQVKILERVNGGAKVVVKGSDHDGQIGWILDDQLKN